MLIKSIQFIIITIVVLAYSNTTLSSDQIKPQSEYTVIFYRPHTEMETYRFNAIPDEITILINAAKAASYTNDLSVNEKIEKYEESIPFIKIIDADDSVLYESNIFKGFNIIKSLINAYLEESDLNMKQ